MVLWRLTVSVALIQAVGISVSVFMLPLFLIRFGSHGFQDIGIYQAVVALFYGIADLGADLWLQIRGQQGLKSYYQIRLVVLLVLLTGAASLIVRSDAHIVVTALISVACLLMVPLGPLVLAGRILTPQIAFLGQRFLALTLVALFATTPLDAIYLQTVSYLCLGIWGWLQSCRDMVQALDTNTAFLEDAFAAFKQLNMRLIPGWVSAGHLLLLKLNLPGLDIAMPVLGDKAGRAWHSLVYATYPALRHKDSNVQALSVWSVMEIMAMTCVLLAVYCKLAFAQGMLFGWVLFTEARLMLCIERLLIPLAEQLVMAIASFLIILVLQAQLGASAWLVGWGGYMLMCHSRMLVMQHIAFQAVSRPRQ